MLMTVPACLVTLPFLACVGADQDSSSNSALASCRSAVSKPSVNQP